MLSYASSATGSGKIIEISAAFVEVWFGYEEVGFKEDLFELFLDN